MSKLPVVPPDFALQNATVLCAGCLAGAGHTVVRVMAARRLHGAAARTPDLKLLPCGDRLESIAGAPGGFGRRVEVERLEEGVIRGGCLAEGQELPPSGAD